MEAEDLDQCILPGEQQKNAERIENALHRLLGEKSDHEI
jgi:hypothetical protein